MCYDVPGHMFFLDLSRPTQSMKYNWLYRTHDNRSFYRFRVRANNDRAITFCIGIYREGFLAVPDIIYKISPRDALINDEKVNEVFYTHTYYTDYKFGEEHGVWNTYLGGQLVHRKKWSKKMTYICFYMCGRPIRNSIMLIKLDYSQPGHRVYETIIQIGPGIKTDDTRFYKLQRLSSSRQELHGLIFVTQYSPFVISVYDVLNKKDTVFGYYYPFLKFGKTI